MPCVRPDSLFGKRAALYARVSTEEQAMRGVSLDAQKQRLFSFANENGMTVAGTYVDEGISARKKYSARTEFVRMLDDVDKGLIDVIIFIKLDRWFRNISDYYEVQSILDKKGVVWIATDEDYDTATANGRLALNIKLAIAQDESDRTSERIRFVFDNMVREGRVISGKVPKGFIIKDKRLTVDPEGAAMVRGVFDAYVDCRSLSECSRRIELLYGIRIDPKTIGRMISNRKYIGEGYGIADWCPSIVDANTFSLANSILSSQKRSPSEGKRSYLFSGLAFCGLCGGRMSAYSKVSGGNEYIYYRCPSHQKGACDMGRQVEERRLESALLSALSTAGTKPISHISAPSSESGERIKKRLERLNELYVSGYIEKDEYELERNKLLAVKTEERPTDFHIISADDYIRRCPSINEKRAFWSRTLKGFHIFDGEIIRAVFYQSQGTYPSGTATTITVSANINARRRF